MKIIIKNPASRFVSHWLDFHSLQDERITIANCKRMHRKCETGPFTRCSQHGISIEWQDLADEAKLSRHRKSLKLHLSLKLHGNSDDETKSPKYNSSLLLVITEVAISLHVSFQKVVTPVTNTTIANVTTSANQFSLGRKKTFHSNKHSLVTF